MSTIESCSSPLQNGVCPQQQENMELTKEEAIETLRFSVDKLKAFKSEISKNVDEATVRRFTQGRINNSIEIHACIDGLHYKCHQHPDDKLDKELSEDVMNIKQLVIEVVNFWKNTTFAKTRLKEIFVEERVKVYSPIARIEVVLDAWKMMSPQIIYYKYTSDYQS
eukprot:TRINITY_DN1744_c0_g1_i2.p1 TRINITY_DN1744_c0_g1~~TRINITY_DN1744_c0_g1_i2.p1  ORF type:complete len:166 (-),score=13.64 TRINITY_DN1744_c0_g1_i2:27-524(-)